MKTPFKKKHNELTGKEFVEVETPENSYYEAVSDRFGIAQVLIYLLLLGFIAISFLTNTDLITYQNLYYFVKDLNASAQSVDVMHSDSVTYPTDAVQSFATYRQGLAVAGNSTVTVFTSGGRQIISKSVQYQNPVAVGSGKYLLVYDLGGTGYSLYNSYTKIYSGKSEGTISGAAMSPSGSYALISQSSDSQSVVTLFNQRFDMINRYTYNGYVCDLAINENGTSVSILITELRNGGFSTVLRCYEPGKNTVLSETYITDSLGYLCEYTKSDTVAILCGNGVYYASERGKLLETYLFGDQKIAAADLNSDGCAVILSKSKKNSENSLIIFDKSGKMLYNEDVTDSADTVVFCKNTAFVKMSDGILQIKAKSGKTKFQPCQTGQKTLVAVDELTAMLCSPQKAVCYRFGNNN